MVGPHGVLPEGIPIAITCPSLICRPVSMYLEQNVMSSSKMLSDIKE